MNRFDSYTRSLKKLLRYILQVATLEQLEEMERVLSRTINARKEQLKPKKKIV
ncbi:hypothetical protein [Paenibacillus sp. EPM92]|uniref:hypothetical protein n=1 Tax=Paenibacillus sp. EPM92 TaxID=1561195 RepID=UPI00191511B5|nr:hypothetical protein [Paenibacillus sp. EPM92]